LDGGYIVIGIDTTEDDEPILPPAGIPENQLDNIGRKLTELGHKITPQYHPLAETCVVQGKTLRAPGGQNRPYKVPVRLSKSVAEKAYYIRRNSCTERVTSPEEEQELVNLSNKIPHDDRLNQRAKVSDLEGELIRDYLTRVDSGLAAYANTLNLEELGLRMNIVGGPPEMRHPVNVGLLFFSSRPEQFFPQAQIDVVIFPDDPGGNVLQEKTFRGPLGKQLSDALSFIQTNIIQTVVTKEPGRAEARRVWNYPFEAIEEILANAVYHRSYETREPIEVRILRDELSITSFPGPDRSISMKALTQGRIHARRYRNRRIGEFLKELKLTEGRGTGIPKVIRAMRENGSPLPRFDTDENREYFTAILPLHPDAKELDLEGDLGGEPTKSATLKRKRLVLDFCKASHSRAEIQVFIGLKDVQHFRVNFLSPLLKAGLLEMTIPQSPTSRLQKYRTTSAGLKYLESSDG
jgi:ATP-dependent DNA helicase RecG